MQSKLGSMGNSCYRHDSTSLIFKRELKLLDVLPSGFVWKRNTLQNWVRTQNAFDRIAVLKNISVWRRLRKSSIHLDFLKLTEFWTTITSFLRILKLLCTENLDTSKTVETKMTEPRLMTLPCLWPMTWYFATLKTPYSVPRSICGMPTILSAAPQSKIWSSKTNECVLDVDNPNWDN